MVVKQLRAHRTDFKTFRPKFDGLDVVKHTGKHEYSSDRDSFFFWNFRTLVLAANAFDSYDLAYDNESEKKVESHGPLSCLRRRRAYNWHNPFKLCF